MVRRVMREKERQTMSEGIRRVRKEIGRNRRSLNE
jgi:hypothetical protein